MNEASRLLFWTNSSYEIEYIGALQDNAFNCDIVLSANDVVEFNFRMLNDIKEQYAIVFGWNDDTSMGWFQCRCKPNSYEFFQQCTYPSAISSVINENGWMHITTIIYHADTMKELYTEVKDNVLIDKCGTYSINVNDIVVDMRKFSI